MKSIRLLPVVIFAATALLLFKGIGLMTSGSYVLGGATAVQAAGGGGGAPVEPDMSSAGVTMADLSPTLGDTAPTLETRTVPPRAASHAEPEGEHQGDPSGHEPISAEAAPPATGEMTPMIQDGAGQVRPIEDAEGSSEQALLARLSARRAELDQREVDLSMRMALLDAAQQRLDERTRELQALEARVAALVDQKQAEEEAGFRAVVSMYETMKARDAAKIFDTLDLPVLLKVARAMNPRKMSPILAAMSPRAAEALTTAMATAEPLPVVTAGGENLAGLPQIVGQ